MKHEHLFIFTPGKWIGEGRVTFSSSTDRMHFYTKWEILTPPGPEINLQQTVEMRGGSDHVINPFKIYEITQDTFKIDFDNESVGMVTGSGVIDPRTIAWEFRGHHNFEGFEVFEIQDNGDYMFHAEYTSTEHFRTLIDGRIWQKN